MIQMLRDKLTIVLLIMILIVVIADTRFIVNAWTRPYKANVSCLSDSMAPTINCSMDVYLRPVKSIDDIDVGDVIVYDRGDLYVMHRLIRIEGDKYITKGDNVPFEDMPIQFDNITDVVVDVVKKE